MDDEREVLGEEGLEPRTQRRRVTLFVVGVVLIVLAALNLTSAGYGTRVRREFADRRSYDMIKPQVHRALPRTLMLGLGGLTLLLVGARLGRSRD
ncbi:MAG: hypothetical protein O2816_17515 [Planctomycetota bacterium]|nr:hypothetical protein [Planctomycetota bacterium]